MKDLYIFIAGLILIVIVGYALYSKQSTGETPLNSDVKGGGKSNEIPTPINITSNYGVDKKTINGVSYTMNDFVNYMLSKDKINPMSGLWHTKQKEYIEFFINA